MAKCYICYDDEGHAMWTVDIYTGTQRIYPDEKIYLSICPDRATLYEVLSAVYGVKELYML